ncbi:endonuclease/exonuclease/phosphatase family protein [Nocardia sp. NPDC127526]|uniref:endonuclease/exonuclease/phosphatase family protein n=1 Tax=Nocardia sp. NPDC127526 TaxID=3345393 RepID=UPI00364539C5
MPVPVRATTRTGRGRLLVFAGASALLTLLLLGHTAVPDIGGLGVALDTAAPWLVVLVPLLALIAFLCRSPAGAATTLIPLLVWAYSFGAWWAPVHGASGPAAADGVRIVSQNLFAANESPAATGRALVATDADIIAVEELGGADRAAVTRILDTAYPYREEIGTVALWSRYPTSDTTAADVGVGWKRGLRTHIATPAGDLVVYVVHLPSVRPGDTDARNRGLATLSGRLTAERAEHVVVAGDFNTASTDRHWDGFAPGYRHALSDAGSGPGFTWPAVFPVARLDHILVRGADIATASVLRLPGPDHCAVQATLALGSKPR